MTKVSEFSIIGKIDINSEAKGKYTIVDITFKYRGSIYDGQIMIRENIETFSFMKKQDSVRQSTLSVRDNIRHEILSEYKKAIENYK